MYQYIKSLLVRHIVSIVVLYILTVSGLFMLGATAYQHWFYSNLTRDVATVYADTLDSLHHFYAEQIAPRAVKGGVQLSTEFEQTNNLLPYPITFSNAFSRQLREDVPGLSINLYSEHPFPNQQQRQLSANETSLLYTLRDNPDSEVIQMREDPEGNHDLLTLARPIVMETSCLECHNNPAWQLGRSWQAGDFRGIREVTIPMMRQPELAERMLTLGLTLTLIAAVSGGIMVLPLVRHQKRTLEQSERLRKELGHLSRHDALTGAANNSWFHERLASTLDNRTGPNDKIGLLFLDMDDFKSINDKLGHRAGDVALKAVSERIRQQLGTDALLGRIGGDEFAVLYDNPTCNATLTELAQQIVTRMQAPVVWDNGTFELSVSVGVTVQNKKTATLNSLLEASDQAMYAAKAQGKNCYACCNATTAA
ncbi:MAG: diguanylate cyclase [Marinobacterium sp.]|nr:diguanylate cyclase [Marinobacterium sp.]